MFRDDKGFTLMELVIAVTILGILLAIAVAALSNSGANARDNSCKSNLRNIDTAIEMYKNSHNSAVPATIDDLISANDLKAKPQEPHSGYGDYTIVGGRAHADSDHQIY